MRAWLCAFDCHCLKLSLWLSIARIVIIWWIAAPVYAALANACGVGADLGLFQPGGESLLVLLEAQRNHLSMLVVVLSMTCGVAYIAAIGVSSAAWILIHARQFLAWQSLLERFNDCIGTLILIAFGSAGSVTVLLVCWYSVFGSIGGWLEPLLGERGTDLVQLATLAIALCGVGVIVIVADVARAIAIVDRSTTQHAIANAMRVYRSAWVKLSLNACVRGSSVVLLQASTAWAVSHYHWLNGSTWACLAAVLAIEISAFLAIMLHVGWLAFLLAQATKVTQTAQH